MFLYPPSLPEMNIPYLLIEQDCYILVYFLDTKVRGNVAYISKWEHVMYHQGKRINQSRIHLLSNTFISNHNLKKFNKKFKIYKKIGSIYVWRAKSNLPRHEHVI